MDRIIFYAIVGRVCIFLLQKFPFTKLPVVGKLAGERGFLHDLLECDLCLGVWVYTFLSAACRLNILDVYIPVLSELVTGGAISFVVWLVKIGFEARFGTIEVR